MRGWGGWWCWWWWWGVKKSYCVENQVVVTVLVDPNSVTDPHSLPFIYLWVTLKYGFMEPVNAGGGGDPNQAGIKPPQILSCSTNISVNIQDLVVFGYKGTIVWKKKQDRKWNLEIAILAHSVLVLWNKHFAVHVFEGAVWKKMATSLIHGTSREPLYHTLAHMQFNCVFPWYYFKVHSSD